MSFSERCWRPPAERLSAPCSHSSPVSSRTNGLLRQVFGRLHFSVPFWGSRSAYRGYRGPNQKSRAHSSIPSYRSRLITDFGWKISVHLFGRRPSVEYTGALVHFFVTKGRR